jgi:hypothetical protein
VGGPQRELHVRAVLAHRPAEACLSPADAVLDGVLVRRQALRGRLVAAPGPQEDQQGAAQASVALVVGGQAAERLEGGGVIIRSW